MRPVVCEWIMFGVPKLFFFSLFCDFASAPYFFRYESAKPKSKESKTKQNKTDADSKSKKIGLKNFELKATLGTGSFGRVRLVQYKPSKEHFAMKMLRKTRVVEMKQENHIKWEKKILSSIRHPFIVNLEASFQDKYVCFWIV